VPRIKRARGYRLYSYDGRRLLDFWQAGGEAILGHRGAEVVTVAKRVLERGLLVGFPSPQEHRLRQALHRLLPELRDHRVVVFANDERMAAQLTVRGQQLRIVEPVTHVLDPGKERGGEDSALLWRPFLNEHFPASELDRWAAVVPVLPAGGLFAARAVMLPRESSVDVHSDSVPEPALAMMTAAAHALVSLPPRPVVALHGFASMGPYLVPVTRGPDDRSYDEVFDRFLAAGVVLSPDPAVPSIMPAELSDGELDAVHATALGAKGESLGN